MLAWALAVVLAGLGLQEEIEASDLPSVEDLLFPELTGDFDGDGTDDLAQARTGDEGVEIAVELSATGSTFVEALGADSLSSVEWEVAGAERVAILCTDPLSCPADLRGAGARDAILVTLDGTDTFLLRWDGDALETIFVDG